MGIWHPRLFAVGIAALLVAVLRFLSYDDAGSPIQLAMQVAMPIPLAIALVILVPRTRTEKSWWIPIAGFLASVPAILHAWTDPPEGAPGDESCAAKGFLPIDWSDAMQQGLAMGSLVVALALVVVGFALAARGARRWQGYWSLMAAGVLLIETYAAPVCVGT